MRIPLPGISGVEVLLRMQLPTSTLPAMHKLIDCEA